MKMTRIAVLLLAMLMLSASALAERKTTDASIDLRFGDDTYTVGFEVSWDEEKPEEGDSDESYGIGDTGPMVMWIQESLKALGYYDGKITGSFGMLTKEAVRQFQKDNGLAADGVAGPKTIARIMQKLNDKNAEGSGNATYNPVIYNVDWFTYKTKIISGSKTYSLTDISTGRTFNIKIQSAGNHADVEPLTSSDTKVLCSLYGVTDASQLETLNKWQRRAMVMTNGNGEQFVCSIYAIPHGKNTISGNNFDGQFCVHFLGSTFHAGAGGSVPDNQNHQEKIAAGAAALEKLTNADGSKVTTIRMVYP